MNWNSFGEIDMKRTVRDQVHAAYSLHDMNVIAFDVSDTDLVMKTQSGLVETTPPYRQPDGYVEFHGVQWDFCFVYLLGVTSNVGSFTGEKMLFKDFLNRYPQFGFSIIDETYGYNMTKYAGFLSANRQFFECIIELYHEGDMVFVAES